MLIIYMFLSHPSLCKGQVPLLIPADYTVIGVESVWRDLPQANRTNHQLRSRIHNVVQGPINRFVALMAIVNLVDRHRQTDEAEKHQQDNMKCH